MAGRKPEVKHSISIIPCFVFVEVVIMAGTVVLAYHFEYADTFPVHIQGFFCYDSAYAKPFPGPEDMSRAPPVLVYSLVTVIPTLAILIGELTAFFLQSNWRDEKTIISGDCCYFNPLLRRVVRFLGVYSFGLFTTTIFANAGQVVTGNQTPHFLSVCRPNYTALGCQSSTQYVAEKRACSGNPILITAARKAFPSKDAALSAYSAIYTVMYITLVFKIKGSRLAKPSICLALLCPAFLVGVVRVAEYRNHWSDVLAGFVTGSAIAVFLVTCVVNNFQSRPPPTKKAAPQDKLPTVPVMVLPCVQSPLEKLSVAQHLSAPSHHSTSPSLDSDAETQNALQLRPAVPTFTAASSRGTIGAPVMLGYSLVGAPMRQAGVGLFRSWTGIAMTAPDPGYQTPRPLTEAVAVPPARITELRSRMSPEPGLCVFPATPDVLIPSRSVTSEV